MRRSTRILLLVGLVAGAAVGGAWEYRSYVRRADATEAEIARYRGALAERDGKMTDKARIARDLRKVTQTTLGSDEEKVTAALRKALNEVVSHYKLEDTSVTSAHPAALKNPASQRGVAELHDRKWRQAKASPDFFLLPATINGKGTLEQAMRVLATLQAQPWVHRIDSFSIKPLGKDRERVELTVSLATIYLTDPSLRERTVGDGVDWSPVNDAQYAAWQPIVSKDVFREPPAPAPQVAAAPPPVAPANVALAPPPPPPPPPYDKWRVSGITRGASGPELMVVNLDTKQWLTLLVGGLVLDAKFVDASGETARIAIGDKEFEVKTGQKLSDRTPLAR